MHGEEVFLNVAVAVIGVIVLVLVLTAWIRRRRSGGRGRWWRGPYSDAKDPTSVRRNPDQSASG
jgi:heme A synthase